MQVNNLNEEYLWKMGFLSWLDEIPSRTIDAFQKNISNGLD